MMGNKFENSLVVDSNLSLFGNPCFIADET